MFYFKCFKKKKKDVFDERFSFILKNKIDTKENYSNVKKHFFRNLLPFQKDNVDF
jgi:hypothetical protein